MYSISGQKLLLLSCSAMINYELRITNYETKEHFLKDGLKPKAYSLKSNDKL
jgi:hypothetical protein